MDRLVTFQALAHLFGHLTKINKKDLKKQKLQLYIDEWRLQDPDLFPLVRLLLPGLDRERTAFGMKESRLADFYVDILGLAKTSHDAFLLKSWEQQSRNTRSDFAEAVFEVLKNRIAERPTSPLTISQVNDLLDELNQAPDKKETFRRLVFACSPEEQKWLVRIILKNTKLGLGDAMVLKCIHPDAQEMYNMSSNLRRICDELRDPHKRLEIGSGALELFSPFLPMLADRVALDNALSEVGGSAIIEPKLDGERMQLHFDGTYFRYWSRRGTEYTYLYGRTGDEGSLTPHIYAGAFKESIKSVILDGEMLAYDPISKDFLPFGTLKGASLDGASSTFNKLHDPRPCFVVFDLVFLNGISLLDKPLHERKRLLDQSVNPIEGHLLIIDGVQIASQQELIEQMDVALSNKLEGIIVKAPNSKYAVGKRIKDWIKLKPDYVDSLCDDLDLLIVGGSYGRGIGGTPGSISSFLCALKDDTSPTAKFKSLCRVGSGLTIGELDRLRGRLGAHFVPFNPKNVPSWLEAPTSLPDRPDVIITHPSMSVVIQVKATQIIESKQYPSGFTLRHPRYIREREDRSWDSAMTISEMAQLYKAEMGSLAKRKISSLPQNTQGKKTKVLRGKWSQAKLASAFSSVDASKVQQSQDILGGAEFHVCAGEAGLDKMDLEKRIVEMGGKITQAPQPEKTLFVLSGRDDGLRLNNIKKQGTLDIVRTAWLHDTLTAGYKLPLEPKYIIFATPRTQEKMSELQDQFGDSYIQETDESELKKLLTKDDWPVEETARNGSEGLVQEIKDRYF